MSLYLNFEPHSWYMGFAIKHDHGSNDPCAWQYRHVDAKHCIIHDKKTMVPDDYCEGYAPRWSAYIDDGNTYYVHMVESNTLKELKHKIRQYYIRRSGGDVNKLPARLVHHLKKHMEQ